MHVPQPLNLFILKNLDLMSNKMLFRVLGSKFEMGYLKFSKKDRKKLLKEKNAKLLDILQTEDCSIDLDTIIMIIVYFFIFFVFV